MRGQYFRPANLFRETFSLFGRDDDKNELTLAGCLLGPDSPLFFSFFLLFHP